MNAGPMGRRGGRMDACPMNNMRGNAMGANAIGMRGNGMFRGPDGEQECIFMIKGDPEKMGDIMNWETDDGKLIELLQSPGGDDTERRVIVKKVVDGDEVIYEVEEEE